MKKLYTNWLRILGVLVVLVLGGSGGTVLGQGSIDVTVKITSVKILADEGNGVDVNKPRARFYVNNSTSSAYYEKDDVGTPYTFTTDKSVSKIIPYNDDLQLRLLVWEEDGCGGDNDYNRDCNIASRRDDLIADKTITIDHKDTTPPGVFHSYGTYIVTGKVEVTFEYQWSAPQPSNPTPASTEAICRDELIVQFNAKDNHVHSQYVDHYKWAALEKYQEEVYPSDATCRSKCSDENSNLDTDCYYSCKYTPIDYEDAYRGDHSISTIGQNTSALSFSTTKETVYVKYREIYKNGTVSPWSSVMPKTHTFYPVTQVSSISITTDDGMSSGNLICGVQPVTFTAVPEAGKDWTDQVLDWYRTVDGNETVFSNKGNEFTDTPPANSQVEYRVKVRNRHCSKYGSERTANPIFYFDPVPENFVGRIKQKETSCEAATDGQIIIEGNASEANKTYYYNIARKDDKGAIQRTSILSSGPIKGNTRFVFPDHILYPGSGKTSLSEKRWRELTTIREGTYVVQVINGEKQYSLDSTLQTVGYCAEEFDLKVTPKPELLVAPPTVANSIDCHGGTNGEVRIAFTGGREPYLLQLLKGERADFATANKEFGEEIMVNTTQYTFNNLPTGHYKVRITLSEDACWSESPKSVHLDQPGPLSLADANVLRSLDDAAYHNAWITCPGADDAYLEVNPQGGNLARAYTATFYKDGVEQQSETFTERYRFANLSSGAYHIKIADACADNAPVFSDTFNISEPLPLLIDSVRTDPITCYGVANGQITVSSRGGTGTRQFIIDGNTSPTSIEANQEFILADLDSGWHTIELIDINGCRAPVPFSFYLKYPTPLNFELDSLVMPLCHGGSDGKLFISPSGGDTITQEYKVSIREVNAIKSTTSQAYKKGDSPLMFDGLPSGNYEVTVHDTDVQRYNCSPVVGTVFLPQPELIVLDTVRVNLPSCAGASDGSVQVKASRGTPGTNPDYYYSIDGSTYVAPNEAGVAVFGNLAAGDYTFYAIDAHHAEYLAGYDTLTINRDVSLCVGTFNFTLDEPEFITVSPTMHPVTCYGTATGGITVGAVAGGRGGYTYEWSVLEPAAGTADGYRTLMPTDPENLLNVPAGNYRLIVRDRAGCASTTTIEVTQPEIPLAISAARQYSESCAGAADGKLEIRAEGGYPPYSYQIDGGTYQLSGFFDGRTAGAYMLAVRDQMGCEVRQMVTLDDDEITVTTTDQLPATVGFEDGLLRLNVTGGQNKRYFVNGVLSTTGAEFSGLAAGHHTVAITYNGQCRWEQTYTIDEVAVPMPALRVTTQSLQNASCSEANDGNVRVDITGGVSPYALQWNDPQQQTTSEASNLAQGTYVLTVTDAAGVTLDYSVTVDGPEPLEIINTAATRPVCYQGADGSAEVTVIGGTAPYTYAWNDKQRQTTARANGLAAGTYTVTVTDRNGCTLEQELTVAPTPAPAEVLEPQAITLCSGQSVTVDAGAEWATYRWTADNGFSSEAQRITIDQEGRYFLEVTSSQGCTAYDTLDLVTTDNLIDAEFLLPTEIAAGDTVVLTEVSWPAPEQTVWLYDEDVTTYESDGEKEYVIFPAPGEYSVKLVVMVGSCMDEVEKKIIVSERSAAVPLQNGRLGYNPKSEYLIYPNPSHGKFTLKISTSHTQRVRVSVYDPLFKYRYHQQTFTDTQSLEEEMDFTHLGHGVYTLMIETDDVIKILRFIIR